MTTKKLIMFWVVFCLPFVAVAADKIRTTQGQLLRLDKQIMRLKQALDNSSDKRETLQDELQSLDKKIAQLSLSTQKMSAMLGKQRQLINTLQTREKALDKQLTDQQEKLAKQLVSHYQLGGNQYLQLLLNQQKPNEITRSLGYYRYIYQARQQVITQVKQLDKELKKNKQNLHDNLLHYQQLREDYATQRQRLKSDQRYQQTVINQLDKQIVSQQQRLENKKQDKQRLKRLIIKLKTSKQASSTRPFYTMAHALPWPTKGKLSQKFGETVNKIPSNGITILAPEGQRIAAVYPGKVVFSDWLKGYGLLIILSHGNGYMSLYAHNQSLFKRTGDKIKQGETLATIGHSGGARQNSLYFEIRHNGKPSNPLKWLS